MRATYFLLLVSLLVSAESGSGGLLRLGALDSVGGGPPPCGADGKCNVGACANDPDCPAGLKDADPGDAPLPALALPGASVTTPCGGRLTVLAGDSTLGAAALDVARRYPHFNAAQKAKDPEYFDAHPSGALATGHAELKGFGVTTIQGKWPKAVDNASGSLDDPTLLFFEKSGRKQDNWEIIGFGYTYEFDRDGERPPTAIGEFSAGQWLIHEAGYHRSPGDGGFTCADDHDLKKSVYKDGMRIDALGCNGIDKKDLKTREFKADKKHGRFWTIHVWLEPDTHRPVIAETDPWCRQGKDALKVPQCAFFKQGVC